ncbi:MAG TPA: hypothetical protein VHW94_00010 [Candidatus Dormibacteraeota bacterium]|nr:hypothetical protein [Candidatus Dormibacteraeota bacterium]
MRRWIGLGLAAALAIAVVAAIGLSIAQKFHPTPPLTVVRGVIGSEKLPYFNDPGVIKVFHDNGFDVQVDTAGSRQIATTVDLSKYDFAFPAGVPAALKIQADHKAKTIYSPFFTPMAIATFKPIVELLKAAGVARDNGTYISFDVKAYLALVKSNKRWSDLQGNTTYPATKSILVTSTDIRTSNSAAMYLSLASYVANSNNIVQDASQAAQALPTVEPLFLRQGLTASSSEEPFQDYLSIGIGKTPMVMIYEAQYLAAAAANDGSITKDMVLMYPDPDVLSKHTVVPLTGNGDKIGQLLLNNAQLQKLATKYGFRTNNAAAFQQFLTAHNLTSPQLVDLIEPPTFQNLEAMITAIQQKLQGG